MTQPAQRLISQYPQFEVIEFNQLRLFRGVDAEGFEMGVM